MNDLSLHLRDFLSTDSQRLFEIESQPEMVRYQEFEPRTLESSQKYVDEAIAGSLLRPRTYFEYAVCLEPEGPMIGRVGGMVDGGDVWIWYVIDSAHQGKGFANAAVRLLLPLLPSKLSVRIECDPRNIPSCKLAETLGFRLVSESTSGTLIKGEDCGSRVYMLENRE